MILVDVILEASLLVESRIYLLIRIEVLHIHFNVINIWSLRLTLLLFNHLINWLGLATFYRHRLFRWLLPIRSLSSWETWRRICYHDICIFVATFVALVLLFDLFVFVGDDFLNSIFSCLFIRRLGKIILIIFTLFLIACLILFLFEELRAFILLFIIRSLPLLLLFFLRKVNIALVLLFVLVSSCLKRLCK